MHISFFTLFDATIISHLDSESITRMFQGVPEMFRCFDGCTSSFILYKIWTTPNVAAALQTPQKIVGTASFSRISKIAATSAPVHAPVPGNGIATKIHRPMALYLWTSRPLRCAFFSRAVIFSCHHGLRFFSQWKMWRMYRIEKGTGTMLPNIAAISASG